MFKCSTVKLKTYENIFSISQSIFPNILPFISKIIYIKEIFLFIKFNCSQPLNYIE